jgi:hypothetical protein
LTNHPTCHVCSAALGDSAYLCTPCTGILVSRLHGVRDLLAELSTAVAKQTAMGTNNGRRTREKRLPYDPAPLPHCFAGTRLGPHGMLARTRRARAWTPLTAGAIDRTWGSACTHVLGVKYDLGFPS